MDPATLSTINGRSPLIFWVDRDSRIRRANATALAMLGLSAEALVGQPMVALFVPGSQERLSFISGGQRRLMELRRADGRTLRVTYSIRTHPDELSVHTAVPVGPQALDELIEERIQEERRAAHCELLGHISHNVNNLLTTILTPAQLLMETTTDPDAREDLADILQATQRARALLREMYRAVRFEAEPMESMQVAPLLADVAARPLVDDLTISLSINSVPAVLGVPDGLRTILHALLSNAEEAGATQVILTVRQEEDRVLLTATDNGSGIEPGLLAHLFEPFATDKARVGAGLSLATSRTRLLGWGGNITASSTLGEGATFTLSLQVAPPPPRPQTESRGRVLLVEDERIIARAMRRIFSSHQIDTALNVATALQMFLPGDYDAVVIDLKLPELSGDELAEILRARDPDVSMLMLTGWMLGSDDPRMRLFDGHIAKPIADLGAARRQLDEAIQLTRQRREQLSEPVEE